MSCHRQCRGFAIAFALAALAIVAAALVTMTSLLAAQSLRSRGEVQQAQLRQMLIAAATSVANDARSWTTAPKAADSDVSLPGVLKADGASLKVRRTASEGGRDVVVEIQASLAGHRITQTLRMSQSAGVYRVVAATLDEI